MEVISIPIGYVAIPVAEYKKLLETAFNAGRTAAPDEAYEQEKLKKAADELENEIASGQSKEPDADDRKVRTKVTQEMVLKMNEMRVANKSIAEIARQLGLAEQTVRNNLAKYAEHHTSAVKEFAKNATPLADRGRHYSAY